MTPIYSGQEYYCNELAVRDGNLITASSAGALLWARMIIEQLDLYSTDTVNAWFNYFSTGEVDYYGQLMSSFSRDNKD